VDELVGGLSAEVQAILGRWRERLNDPRQPLLHRMRNLDAETYMPGAVLAKVDRMSMQVALEVRCPLLDRDVARFARELPAAACWRPPRETKRILKSLTARYLPREWLDRPKMGFGLPSNAWSKEAMLELARELLDTPGSQLAGLLAPGTLHNVVERQAQPGRFSIYQLWPLLILELWLRKVPPVPAEPATT
jgi:asparagine synthase (glutamine-hydrolysing)